MLKICWFLRERIEVIINLRNQYGYKHEKDFLFKDFKYNNKSRMRNFKIRTRKLKVKNVYQSKQKERIVKGK